VRAFDVTDGQHLFDFEQRGMNACPIYAAGHLIVTGHDATMAFELRGAG
jgi:hypothetical protein